jgi:casein kinase I family protein HRR25
MDVKVGERYKVGRKIGSGSFSAVYSGIDTVTEEIIAIKLERTNQTSNLIPQEAQVYQALNNDGGEEIVE